MREWDRDVEEHRHPTIDERSRQHSLRLGVLVVAATVVALLMVLLIGPMFNTAE